MRIVLYEAHFTVPAKSSATIILPNKRREELAPGEYKYTWSETENK